MCHAVSRMLVQNKVGIIHELKSGSGMILEAQLRGNTAFKEHLHLKDRN